MKKLSQFTVLIAGSALLLAGAESMSKTDQTFAMKAAQGGMAEVQLGQLAVNKASSQKVKDFGQKMIDDHTKINDQLKSLASKDNITLPTAVSTKDQALMDRLSGMSGSAFDRAYMNAMVKDHQADIAEFEKEAGSGTNADLKSFASSSLPTLKDHLSLAQDTIGSTQARK